MARTSSSPEAVPLCIAAEKAVQPPLVPFEFEGFFEAVGQSRPRLDAALDEELAVDILELLGV